MAKTGKKCNYCGKVFLAENKEINRGNAKYCSLSCAAKAEKTKQFELICKHCGKLFIGYHATAKYCSLSCKQKHYRAQQKVDNTKDMKYYYKIFEYIPCELCGWNKGPRDIHHIIEVSQGGKNEISNLISLCPNCHRLIHRNLISKDSLIDAVKNRTISSSSENTGAGR